MDFTDIAMLFLKGIAYVGSSASLLALCTYIFLAVRGNSPTLLSTRDARCMNWKSKMFLGLTAIGFLVCMFQGAEAMLFWMPDSWGQIDQDGEFQTVRSSLAMGFAMVGGTALVYFMDQATRDNVFLRVLREQMEGERKVHAAKSLSRLDALKSDFEGKIEDLADKVSRGIGEMPFRIEDLQIRAYRELLSLIETRRTGWQSQ